MTRTRTVDRATCQKIGAEIEAAIDPILARHGFERGKTTRNYGEYFGMRFQATPIGAEKPQESDWKHFASLFGLPEDALGKTIQMGGRTFTITGLNTRARRMPVMLADESGKSFKAPAESVALYLSRA